MKDYFCRNCAKPLGKHKDNTWSFYNGILNEHNECPDCLEPQAILRFCDTDDEYRLSMKQIDDRRIERMELRKKLNIETTKNSVEYE